MTIRIANEKIRRQMLTGLLILFAVTPVFAQTSSSTDKMQLSAWLRGAYTTNRKYLVGAAATMPEEFFSLRPGVQTEVRTFGQIVGHIANFNFLWCSDAKGEKNPNYGNDFEKVTAKADLVKALNSALSYCDGVYANLTDASGMDTVQVTLDNGQTARVLRASRLILNYAHNNEHYGNLVTYMRMKSIVPPSSAPR